MTLALDEQIRLFHEFQATCGPNAQAILNRHMRRLSDGAKTYGNDFDDGRNLIYEAINEASDLGDYIEADAALSPGSTRMCQARALHCQLHRLLQAEYSERAERASRLTIPEAAE